MIESGTDSWRYERRKERQTHLHVEGRNGPVVAQELAKKKEQGMKDKHKKKHPSVRNGPGLVGQEQ